MTQWQAVLELFRKHDGVLTTADFAMDRHLSCEYRRALCDLKKHGYFYKAEPIKKGLWLYRLIEIEENGQTRLCA